MKTKINLDRPFAMLGLLTHPNTIDTTEFNQFDPEIYGYTSSPSHKDLKEQLESWEYPNPETLP